MGGKRKQAAAVPNAEKLLAYFKKVKCVESQPYTNIVVWMLPKVTSPLLDPKVRKEMRKGKRAGAKPYLLGPWILPDELPEEFESGKRATELRHQLEVSKKFQECHYAFMKIFRTLFGLEPSSGVAKGDEEILSFLEENLDANGLSRKDVPPQDQRLICPASRKLLKDLTALGIDSKLAEISTIGHLWPLLSQARKISNFGKGACSGDGYSTYAFCEERFRNFVILALNFIRIRYYQHYCLYLKNCGRLKAPFVKCACLPDRGRFFTLGRYPVEHLSNLLLFAAYAQEKSFHGINEAFSFMENFDPVGTYKPAVYDYFRNCKKNVHVHHCSNLPRCPNTDLDIPPKPDPEGPKMKVCRRCKAEKLRVRAFYCSDACHRAHWPVHAQLHFYLR